MWQRFRKGATTDNQSALSIGGSHIAFARVQRDGRGGMQLAATAIRADSRPETWAKRLSEQLDGLDLAKSQAISVLPGGSYQLMLVEIPDVPSSEVKSAVRWQIKDLLDHPVDDTVIEILNMPNLSSSNDKGMAYAVTTPRSNVERHLETLHDAGFSTNVIDIPELCARNIAALLPQDSDGVALLHFAENQGFMTITRQGVLYLTRRIETGRETLLAASGDEFARTELISGIALDIKRSLDYYESHFDRRPLNQLVLGPGSDISGLAESLTEHLGLTVSNLDLNDMFSVQPGATPEEQGTCLLAIGAALRSHSLAA